MSEFSRLPHNHIFRCAVVTGGNKGIGFDICRQLASNGIKVILTARDEIKGEKAVQELRESGLTDLVFHQLDVKDSSSVDSLAKYIGIHFGKLDILINNAGQRGVPANVEAFRSFKEGDNSRIVDEKNANLLTMQEQTNAIAEECIKTNYYGTKLVTEGLLPLLQLSNSARIVNVSSLYGQLSYIPNENIRCELKNLDSLTEGKIDEILESFLHDFKDGALGANGWPTAASAYKLSKVSVNAYTRILAKRFPKILSNCVHPGYVATDLTYYLGNLTPEEGARAPVMVALLPDDGSSGMFFDRMNIQNF